MSFDMQAKEIAQDLVTVSLSGDEVSFLNHVINWALEYVAELDFHPMMGFTTEEAEQLATQLRKLHRESQDA